MKWAKLNFLFASGFTYGCWRVQVCVQVCVCARVYTMRWLICKGWRCEWINMYQTGLENHLSIPSWIFLMQFPPKRDHLLSFYNCAFLCFPSAGRTCPVTSHCMWLYFPWLVLTMWGQTEVTRSGNPSEPMKSQCRAHSPGCWELFPTLLNRSTRLQAVL